MNSKVDSEPLLNPISSQADKADDFLTTGEYKLLQGYFSEAMDDFHQVDQLVAGNSHITFRQGLALFEYGSEEGREQALLLASKKFRKAASINPEDAEILHAWGNTLTLLGERYEEHHFFLEAKEKYEKIFQLSHPSTDLFWDYGIIWYHIAEHSGEPIDLQKAIQAFEKAEKSSSNLPSEFWIDYGTAALILSQKINDIRQIFKAVSCFKRATNQNETCFDSWSSLSEALQMLFEQTHDEDHFSAANNCYEKASKLCPGEASLWLEWAKFLLNVSQKNRDVKRLRHCLDKCHHAHVCDPDNEEILAIWAESLALLGQLTDRLDLIMQAENKVSEALEINEDDPDIWHSLGVCFSAFGAYFNDYDYYYQAIEKFQTGLSLDRTNAKLWHAIARTYATVGDLESDVEALEQSFYFFSKAIHLSPSNLIHIDYAHCLSKLGELLHKKELLERAIQEFEYAFHRQKNAVYLQPDWLFAYAHTLDILGDFYDEKIYYTRAIDIFSHVLMLDPDYPEACHRLAQALIHLGEMSEDVDFFCRAVQYLRLALKNDEDNDNAILDWGICLINLSQYAPFEEEKESYLLDASQKLSLAAKLGNLHAYYQLSCLHSLMGQQTQALHFLQRADQFKALPPLEDLLADDWLDNLRSTCEFREFLSLLEDRPNFQEER